MFIDIKEYEDFFTTVTGFPPYDFQKRIAQELLGGNNIIMHAPTGAGKTWASIVPFLYALYKGIPFPKKLIYSLPLRVLANSLYNEVSEKVQKLNNLLDRQLKVTIQTGENNRDPYFVEGDIIFTTIDQSISSLLSIPLSLPINKGNINPVALLSSYIIYDEFHLLDTKRALSTIYNILSRINKTTPFCLMTATLSDKLLDSYCFNLKAKKISINDLEINNIGSQRNKTRNVVVKREPINVENIIGNHKKRTIVICNTVDSCQETYLQIKSKIGVLSGFKDTKLICIHSQLYSQDRKNKEALVKQYFKKDSNTNAILVATQVVEVGIDITCETMHTEISPINSFLQRTGRCARYEGEKGLIFVYDVNKFKSDGDEKKQPYLPYDENICIATLNALEKLGVKSKLDYRKSKKLVNEILTTEETKIFNAIDEGRLNRFNEIIECWTNPDKSYASRLIRQIDSVSVLIHEDISGLITPYSYDFISINRYSLISKLKKIQKEYEDDWLIRVVEEPISEDEEIFGKYSYPPVEADDKRLAYENILILNPKYIFYDKGIGLNFRGIGKKQSIQIDKENEKNEFKMTKDTYREHVELMIKAYEHLFQNDFEYILDKLNFRYNFHFDFDELIKFVLIMHDYGKLNKTWQSAIKKFQAQKGYTDEFEILAHSDYNPQTDFNIKPKLPNHAGIGGAVAASIIEGVFNDSESLCISILNSIVKHHSISNNTMESYTIIKNGKELVLSLLRKYCPSIYEKIDHGNCYLLQGEEERFTGFTVDFSRIGITDEAVLYFIFSRVLRLCDQKSFEYKRKVSVFDE